MADAQSTGERPLASSQNALNAETTTYDDTISKSFSSDWFNDQESAGEFYINVQSQRTAELPDFWNLYFHLDLYETFLGGYPYGTLKLYEDATDTLLVTITYTGGAVFGDAVEVSEDVNPYVDVKYYVYVPPGYYRAEWTLGKFAGQARGGTIRWGIESRQGQTNIPAGAPIRIWSEDFSRIQAKSDTAVAKADFGIDIDLHTSCRAGWDDPDIDVPVD